MPSKCLFHSLALAAEGFSPLEAGFASLWVELRGGRLLYLLIDVRSCNPSSPLLATLVIAMVGNILFLDAGGLKKADVELVLLSLDDQQLQVQ